MYLVIYIGSEAAMRTFCSMGLDFWWNWEPEPMSDYVLECALGSFVPMIGAPGAGNAGLARRAGRAWGSLMGYDEPGRWGRPDRARPAPPGPDPVPGAAFRCGDASLARAWQGVVKAYKRTNPYGVVVSPAMADPSTPGSAGGDSEGCAGPPRMRGRRLTFCPGWMRFRDTCVRERVNLVSLRQVLREQFKR